ncbi:hypothetical protein KOSB73_220708 [Klebsiella grimontii]|uniref:Uncharacterized protein n=1 Tax=Klebsiella grimontii TaxID=2058152 RepID=A0A285B0V1_9ENTR|nr:hypothetical protein KOSB73_220708 [Klebsiella grimontii]
MLILSKCNDKSNKKKIYGVNLIKKICELRGIID